MKKIFNIFLVLFAASFSAFAQHSFPDEHSGWVVLLGVYDEPLPAYYFNTQTLGKVEMEWNGYFYSYYTQELGSESEANELRAKANQLGHVSAAVTTEHHAKHPCVFCASLRDSACWGGRGTCGLIGYARHDNFHGQGKTEPDNHGMKPGVEMRKNHYPRNNDVAGTHFYVSPNPNENKEPVAKKNAYAYEPAPRAEMPQIAMRGLSPKNEEEMVAKSIDIPKAEKKVAVTEKSAVAARTVAKRETPKPKVDNAVKGNLYFAQILATSAETAPQLAESNYSLFKETQEGVNKYVVGPFKDYNSCAEYCKTAQAQGFTGAFPVSYKDGVRSK